jgi:hypothetical protein
MALVPHLIPAWFILIPAAAFLALQRHYENVHRDLKRSKRAIEFCERSIARLEGRWIGQGAAGENFKNADHLFANDLDLFGKGSLFELLCTARTRIGQETLARWLCNPASREEILRRQQAVDELRNNVDLREQLATFAPDHSSQSGFSSETAITFDVVSEWVLQPPVLDSLAARLAAPFLVAFTIGSLAFLYWFGAGAAAVTLAVSIQLGFALWYRRRVLEVAAWIHEPAAELRLFQIPLQLLEGGTFSSVKLRELTAALEATANTGRPVSEEIRRMTGLVEMLKYRRNTNVGPFLPLVLWSTQVAFAAEAWRKRHRESLHEWMAIIGEFEALCALAGYAFEHPECPFPEVQTS